MEKIKKTTGKPKLRLIRSGCLAAVTVGAVEVVVAPEDKPPFGVDAAVYEEDTFFVLSAPLEVRDPQVPLARLIAQVRATKPEKPGRVLVRGKDPVRFLAIVHDFNQEPSWQEEWIVKALEGIFRAAEKRKLASLSLPLLGTLHGSLKKERFLVLLRAGLERMTFTMLRRIWLMVPPETAPNVFAMLTPTKPSQKKKRR